MRIDIVAIGSRGDVQLYVALGLGLRDAGYRVRLVTLAGYDELMRDRGLDHLVIGESPQQIAKTDAGKAWVRERSNSTAGHFRGFVRLVDALMEDGTARYWSARQDVDAILVSPMGVLVGEHIAERLRVPVIRSQYAPPVLPGRYDWDGNATIGTAIWGHVEPVIHETFHLLGWTKIRGCTNAARQKVLGLPPLSWTAPFSSRNKTGPLLASYSPAVVPPKPDWPDWIHVTGYWFLDDFRDWTPPPELADFLAAGPPPIFIGFGSTPFPNAEATGELLIRAMERVEKRAVLVAGEGGLPIGRLSPEILSIKSVPHGWLFDRVSAAVHHGGSGVTGSALRAGLPSAVVPIFGDQPFWGNRVHRVGAGPAPIPAKSLTEEKLVDAIRALSSEKICRRAAELGEKIGKEDGVARAVEVIDRYLVRPTLRSMSHHNAR